MTIEGHRITLPREQMTQGLALMVLLILTGLAIAGPSGLLAWGENANLLKQRQQQIAVLVEERDALKNRVDLLDPNNADPDLVGEELRRNLNVVHPDEVVLTLSDGAD
ncbi:MAG: septum formation initiator family protein [Pontixanthobacter sp.]